MGEIKRIILHWSGGVHNPSEIDKMSYHYLISGSGRIYEGKYKPEDNINIGGGKGYAMHCGGGNTGAIGVSFCGMYGYTERLKETRYPITRIQFETGMQLSAELSRKYGIEVNTDTVMTHHEFGERHPSSVSYRKPDITYLSPYPYIESKKVGNFIRSKIRWYLGHPEGRKSLLS